MSAGYSGAERRTFEQRLEALQDLRKFSSESSYRQHANGRSAPRINSPVDEFPAVLRRVADVHSHAFVGAANPGRHGRLDFRIAEVTAQRADLRFDELLQGDSSEELLAGGHTAWKFFVARLLKPEPFLDLPIGRGGRKRPAHHAKRRGAFHRLSRYRLNSDLGIARSRLWCFSRRPWNWPNARRRFDRWSRNLSRRLRRRGLSLRGLLSRRLPEGRSRIPQLPFSLWRTRRRRRSWRPARIRLPVFLNLLLSRCQQISHLLRSRCCWSRLARFPLRTGKRLTDSRPRHFARPACASNSGSRRFGRRRFRRRRHLRDLRVRHDFDNENSLPCLDLVAVCQHRVLDFRAVQESPVAALAVLHSAASQPALHCKVHSGHERILRQSHFRAALRTSDSHTLPAEQRNQLPRLCPSPNFQNYTHAEFCPCAWIISP